MVCRQKRSDVHVTYTLIAANQAELPVAPMCDHLEVSKSGYYDWYGRVPSKRIAAVMRQAHIRGVSRRRCYVVTTTRDKRQTSVCRHRCQSALGGRYDLRADLGGFPVFGRRHRRVQPQSRGLGVWSEHDG